jgi:hypothetical protein
MTEVNYEIIINDFGQEVIKRTDADGKLWWIPADSNNSDYQAYLRSLEENN